MFLGVKWRLLPVKDNFSIGSIDLAFEPEPEEMSDIRWCLAAYPDCIGHLHSINSLPASVKSNLRSCMSTKNLPYFTLNDGNRIPSVGMGCWMGSPGGGEKVREMCSAALKHGYRLFDTASGYGNEVEVGYALQKSGIPRAELFVTTKLPNSAHHKVREAFEKSLEDLGCDYIDLYLLHWPQAMLDGPPPDSMADPRARVPLPNEHPTFVETWKEMEKLLETGKVKSLGVSNFSIKTLTELLPHCTIIPAVNQVELHPYLPQRDLKDFCDHKGILLTAYSSLGQNSTVLYEEDVTIKRIAEDLKTTPAQVLLSWSVQKGIVVVPKTANEERMVANITLVAIPEKDMLLIDDIHRQPGMHKSLVWSHEVEEVFGWKYEWLGWNIGKGGAVLDR